jgi:hypothetical protein
MKNCIYYGQAYIYNIRIINNNIRIINNNIMI